MMLTAVMILSFGTAAAASIEVKNVAVILEPPVESFDKPEKVYDAVWQTVNKLYRNAAGYNLISIDETDGYIQVYREENNLEGADVYLKKTDIENICGHLDSDFAVYLRITANEPKITGIKSITSVTDLNSVKVVLDFRVWANDKQDFIYTKRITKTDSTLEKSLSKGLQEVEKDANKIRAAMED